MVTMHSYSLFSIYSNTTAPSTFTLITHSAKYIDNVTNTTAVLLNYKILKQVLPAVVLLKTANGIQYLNKTLAYSNEFQNKVFGRGRTQNEISLYYIYYVKTATFESGDKCQEEMVGQCLNRGIFDQTLVQKCLDIKKNYPQNTDMNSVQQIFLPIVSTLWQNIMSDQTSICSGNVQCSTTISSSGQYILPIDQ